MLLCALQKRHIALLTTPGTLKCTVEFCESHICEECLGGGFAEVVGCLPDLGSLVGCQGSLQRSPLLAQRIQLCLRRRIHSSESPLIACSALEQHYPSK